jgi:hypothetical protein
MERAGGRHARLWPKWARVAALSLWALVGCGPSEALLRLDDVVPSRVHYGVTNTVVTLRGRFVPRLAVSVGDDSVSGLEDTFSVRVGTQELNRRDIKLISTEELQVTLPRLAIGSDEETLYSITVTDPRGHTQTLEDKLVVVVGEPAQVVLVNAPATVPVDAWTLPIRAEFRDANGYPARVSRRQASVRISTDSSTGLFSLDGGISQSAQELQLVLPQGTEGFDFAYRDPVPGDSKLTVTADGGVLSWLSLLKVGERGQPAQIRLSADLSGIATGDAIPMVLEVQDATGALASVPQGGAIASLSVAVTGTTSPDAATAGAGLALHMDGPYAPSLQALLREGTSRMTVYLRGTLITSVQIGARIADPRTGLVLASSTFHFSTQPAAPVVLDAPLPPEVDTDAVVPGVGQLPVAGEQGGPRED